MLWSNRTAVVPALPNIPPMPRFGGRIPSTPELRLSLDASSYVISGSGTIARLPRWPDGARVRLRFTGTPTFVNSTNLNCPAGASLTAAPGDLVTAVSQGAGRWSLFHQPGASAGPTLAGPRSGTTTGPYPFGLVNATYQNTLGGTGTDSFGLRNSNVTAVRGNLTLASGVAQGGGVNGGFQAGMFAVNCETTNALNSITALAGTAYTNVAADVGIMEGVNGYVFVDASGSAQIIVGLDAAVGGATGASITHRWGIYLNSYGSVQGATTDVGILVTAEGTVGWKKMFQFSSDAHAAFDPAADLFYFDSGQTIANVFNCANATVTGNILNFPNVTLTGAGALTLAEGVKGTATNNNAGAGFVGEYVSSSILSNAAVSLATTTVKDVTSISLTAGDWDVWGCVALTGGSTTTLRVISGWLSTASATFPATSPESADNGFGLLYNGANDTIFVNWGNPQVSLTPKRFSLASTTTIYMSTLAIFSVSTCSAFGFIGARRRR
jgi:hypothetical protein